jgi:hypothetical protein
MTDAEFWEVEHSLWVSGVEVFTRWVAAECLMVFPDPTGIIERPALLQGVAASARWERADFSERLLRRIGEATAVLAYRVEAARRGGLPQRGLCTSTYSAEAGVWWLVQHQHTPA